MTAPLEHRYRYMTRINWAGIANLANCDKEHVRKVWSGLEKNKRLSALLATMELPRKIDWRQVAERLNPYLVKPCNPRYIREIACGQRRNKKIYKDLKAVGIIDMVEKQRSFCSAINKQEAI